MIPQARRHLCFGWWSLLVFLTMGAVLEGLHGFKVRWYLDVANEARRHLWTLAHAHGTLLAVVNIVFGLAVNAMSGAGGRDRGIASACLLGAGVLLPGGFLLGGLFIQGADPGLGIVLVPIGAALLFVAVLVAALASRAPAGGQSDDDGMRRPRGG